MRQPCGPGALLSTAIGEAVLGWLRHLGADSEAIDAGDAYNVQLGRLYLRSDDQEIAALKANSPVADDLLGLPRTVRGEGRPIGSLPVNGYNAFFEVFESVLTEAGVVIRTGQPVVPRFENDTAILRVRGETLRPDLIVWAANPTPVIAAAGLGRLDDPFVDITVSAGTISGPGLPADPHYMQVYSTGSPITRIFSFPREGGHCVSVEHMPDGRSLPDLQTHVQEICKSFYGDVRIEIVAQQPQRGSMRSGSSARRAMSISSTVRGRATPAIRRSIGSYRPCGHGCLCCLPRTQSLLGP